MPRLYHVLSNITNAVGARMRQVAVPDTKLNRAVCEILYDEGLIGAVAKGDYDGPYNTGEQVPVTPENVSKRQLWLRLKYKLGEPIMRECRVVSKPSRRVYATVDELKLIAAGREASHLLKASQVGQVTILHTPYGVLELKEALKKNVGGEVLCYAR